MNILGRKPDPRIEISRRANEMFERMRSAYPIGSTIEYLDCELVVSRHNRPHGTAMLPCMSCDYVDNDGVIRTHDFNSQMVASMLSARSKNLRNVIPIIPHPKPWTRKGNNE